MRVEDTLNIADMPVEKLHVSLVASQLEAAVGKYRLGVLIFWSMLFFLVTGWLAATKLLWADELITSYVSSLPSLQAIWSVLVQGGDAHPPLSFALLHAVYATFGIGPLSSRIPFIAAFWIMSLCIFFFVEKHCGNLYGLAAMSLPLLSGAYAYAYEARPYALVLAAAAASLLAWQRACLTRSLWPRAGLFLALAVAVSSHFFGVLLFAAIVAGEAARTFQTRRVDWSIWLAVTAALVPLAFYLPIARATAKLYFQTAFWSKPRLGSIADTYRVIVELTEPPILLAILSWAALKGTRPQSPERTPKLPLHEVTAVGMLVLFPAYAVLAAVFTGAYTERYGLPATMGITIALATFAWSRTRGSKLFAMVALCVFLAWFIQKQSGLIRQQMAENPGLPFGTARTFDGQHWVRQAAQSELPLVLSDGVFFTQFQQYAPASLRGRFLYLPSPANAMAVGLAPAGETTVLAIDRFLQKMPIASYDRFVETHRHFLLCVRTGHEGWLPLYFARSGAHLTLLTDDRNERLFDVRLD